MKPCRLTRRLMLNVDGFHLAFIAHAIGANRFALLSSGNLLSFNIGSLGDAYPLAALTIVDTYFSFSKGAKPTKRRHEMYCAASRLVIQPAYEQEQKGSRRLS